MIAQLEYTNHLLQFFKNIFYYARIMLIAFSHHNLLYSKLCWHNQLVPIPTGSRRRMCVWYFRLLLTSHVILLIPHLWSRLWTIIQLVEVRFILSFPSLLVQVEFILWYLIVSILPSVFLFFMVVSSGIFSTAFAP